MSHDTPSKDFCELIEEAADRAIEALAVLELEEKERARLVQTEKVAAALTAAYHADPMAIKALLVNRVPCGRGLIDDPHVVVDGHCGDPPDRAWVGALGLINAVLRALDLPLVCVHFDAPRVLAGTDVDENFPVTGFSVYKPPEPIEEP